MQLAVAFAPTMLTGILPKVGLMAAGVALNFMMSDKKKDNAARMSDLKVSSSTYGRGIPKVYGTWRCTGNMFWATDIVEKKKYVGQKGKQLSDSKGSKKADKGKAQEVYEYYGNFAMGLCEGEVAEVIRIWADSNLIYDKYNPGGYYDDDGVWHPVVSVGFSQPSDRHGSKSGAAQKKGSNRNSGMFPYRFYGGTEYQEKDPYMVSRSGEAYTPAYKGLCYLFFENFPLMDFGNRIPTITAEVVPALERKISVYQWVTLEEGAEGTAGIVEADMPAGSNGNYHYTIFPYSDIDITRGHLVDRVVGYFDGGYHQVIRVYDLTTQHEIVRFTIPDGKTYIGIDGDGYIVVENGDPDSYGLSSISRYNATTGTPMGGKSINFLFGPYRCFPLALLKGAQAGFGTIYLDIFGRATVVPLGSNIVAGLPLLHGFSSFFGTRWFPGAPGTQQDILVAAAISYDNANVYAYSTEYLALNGDYTIDTTKPFMEPPLHGAGPYYVVNTVYSIAADRWGVLYLDTNDYYFSTFTADGTLVSTYGPIETSVHLSVVTQYTYQPIPVIKTTRWSMISATAFEAQMLEFDLSTGKYEIIDLPSPPSSSTSGAGLLPYLSGAQYYIESRNAVVYYGVVPASPDHGWYTVYPDKFTPVGLDLRDIVLDVVDRAGVDGQAVSVSNLNAVTVAGFAIDNPAPARQVLEQLMQVYFFDACESDGVLKFVSRGQAVAVTIPEENLAIMDGGSTATSLDNSGGATKVYEEIRHQEIDLPQTVNVSFINAKKDYQTGTEHYRRPRSPMPVMQSREVLDVNVPIAMDSTGAKQVAEQICIAAWAERGQHHFSLPTHYLEYDPTDVALVTFNSGLRFHDRIIKMDIGANYTIEVETVFQSQPYYDTATVAEDLHNPYDPVSEGYTVGGSIPNDTPAEPAVQALLMDIPFVDDIEATSNSGELKLYWAAGAYGAGFKGAYLQLSKGDANWSDEGMTTLQAIWGIVGDTVPAPRYGAFVTDTETTITLYPQIDYEAAGVYTWSSIADVDWPSDTNMVLIGEEIILFKNATVNGDGSVTLDTLIRGWRGTDYAVNLHAANESFCLLNLTSDKQAGIDSSYLGLDVLGKLISGGIGNLIPRTSTVNYAGKPYKPWAVNEIAREDDVSYDATITWARRTRYGGALVNLTGTVPLNEESELYRVFFRTTEPDMATFNPNDPAQYVRTVDVTSSSYVYTSAMRTADGLADTDPFWVVIYQLSATVGLGFPSVALLETSRPAYR